MSNINLLIANSDQYFTGEELEIIRAATDEAEVFIADRFDFDYKLDLVVVSPSFMLSTIPEDGIVGRTYSSRLVGVALNKQEAPISKDITFETICHEMSHSMRWQKLPEYACSLFDESIMEGLAVALSIESMQATNRRDRSFFLRTMIDTDQKMIDEIIAQLDDKFYDRKYNYYNTVYPEIFYTGNDKLPRWTGYRLGYYFVKEYLEQSDTTIQQATLASYDAFMTLTQ